MIDLAALGFVAIACMAITLDSAHALWTRFRLRRVRDRRAGVGEVPPWPDDVIEPDLIEQLDEWWRWERYFNDPR